MRFHIMSEAEQNNTGLLIEEEIYMTSGVHIGTQQKSADMKDFTFKVRQDGLRVLDIKKTDERIRVCARMLARMDPKRILVVSARQYGQKPSREFSKAIGAPIFSGRFVPGTLTNPANKDFIEPEIIFCTDPAADKQALKEALDIGIPIIALCDANNETRNVDLVIPSNNKGRRAIACVYWVLAREVLIARGDLKDPADFTLTIDDFESKL